MVTASTIICVKRIERKKKMKKPVCNLIGCDGNIFNLMGIVGRTLRQKDLPEQAKGRGL